MIWGQRTQAFGVLQVKNWLIYLPLENEKTNHQSSYVYWIRTYNQSYWSLEDLV